MRIWIYIALFSFSLMGFSQDSHQKFNRTKWEELKGKIKYKKSPPSSTNRNSSSSEREGDSYKYDPDRYGEGRGSDGSNGIREYKEEEESSSFNTGSGSGWATPIMIILGVFLVALLVYQFLFRKQSESIIENTEIEEDIEEFDIHTIQKSDLEIALEKALAENDYRKCIRIYFTFILKELSTNGLIEWEKEKTNYDYLRELNEKKEFHGFRNSVEIFEIIWYGKRMISKDIYLQLEPDFKNYLKQISAE